MDSLVAENLVLRMFQSGDAGEFIEAVRESGRTVGRWLPWWKEDFSLSDAEDWFRTCEDAITSGTGFDIGIFGKDNGLLIGSVAVNRIDTPNRTGSLGYWVRESQQSKGYCSEAVRRMADFAFYDLDLTRLEIVVLVENTASRKVAENAGAKLECVAENRLMYRGQPSAAAVYSLLNIQERGGMN